VDPVERWPQAGWSHHDVDPTERWPPTADPAGSSPLAADPGDLAVRSPLAASNAAAAGSMVAAPPGSSVGRPDPDCPARKLLPTSNYGGPWMWARRTHGWAQRAFPRVYLFLFFNRFTEAGIQLPQKMPHLP
jgi:hypothetical protein